MESVLWMEELMLIVGHSGILANLQNAECIPWIDSSSCHASSTDEGSCKHVQPLAGPEKGLGCLSQIEEEEKGLARRRKRRGRL